MTNKVFKRRRFPFQIRVKTSLGRYFGREWVFLSHMLWWINSEVPEEFSTIEAKYCLLEKDGPRLISMCKFVNPNNKKTLAEWKEFKQKLVRKGYEYAKAVEL
jgi:hypothetical protein